jgi:carbamoyl-phosphate synthase/aspartate carbamoyltransferase
MTYNGTEDDIAFNGDGVIVLGCGAYCIGSSVEFDWCAVSAVRTLRELGHQSIVINYNPETVSTDYDESDRLYFEEISLERTLDIYERELAAGVIVSVGGQIPNNLAVQLHQQGVNILGTSADSIDRCEDRNRFSAMLDMLDIDQPAWTEASSVAEAASFATSVKYPVLLRPSYVLSGAAMRVASSASELTGFLKTVTDAAPNQAIVVSKFINNAKEIEFDGVADKGLIINYAISEHIENAGVHSGDATLVLPAQKLWTETIRQVRRIASSVALELRITGPFNLQLMAVDNRVMVIELNLRASRTFPFISKTFDFNFISLATKAIMGMNPRSHPIALVDIDYCAVKAPMFSFTRLHGADPTLGVEMSSTGEVACFGLDLHDAYLNAMLATNFKMPDPKRDAGVLVSIGSGPMSEPQRREFLPAAKLLLEMGYKVLATPGTAEFLNANNCPCTVLHKPASGQEPSAAQQISDGQVQLVINIADNDTTPDPGAGGLTDGYIMRRAAVDFGVSLMVNIKCAILLITALHKKKELSVLTIDEFYNMVTERVAHPHSLHTLATAPAAGYRPESLTPTPFTH